MNDPGRSGKRSKSARPASPVVRAFAKRLNDWRRQTGLPLKRVAQDVGVSVSIVSEWEHMHRFPSLANLEALAAYMHTPVCCLLYTGPGPCPHSRTPLN